MNVWAPHSMLIGLLTHLFFYPPVTMRLEFVDAKAEAK